MIYIKSFRYKNVYILLYPDGSYLIVPAEDYILHDLTSLSYDQVKKKCAISDPTHLLK
jgi:hypothetical protein